jgi:translation initiation factor IF-1
VQYPPR